MLDFIKAYGFESSIENEKRNYDACIKEYNGRVVSVRCIQSSNKHSSNKHRGGLVVWIWSVEYGRLTSDYKMVGIAPACNDLSILIREAKSLIDSL